MRRYTLSPIFCLLALIILASCSPDASTSNSAAAPDPCQKTSNVKGSITSIHTLTNANFIGSFMLNGTKEQQTAFDQVVVTVRPTTQIFEKQGNQCQATTFARLQAGQRLQIQTTGTAAQSYPPQVEATEIVILSA